ncbi:DHH family phosphoesterase [Arenicella xantha]|uniref:Single-stranded DNA-specific DHH superfamily exonuclease n=1 Tax=Arenicella xantha TaxID=644221 RepID=A0A395JLG3_9GAMM|nr:DHH family phosphoesterase [Arenicella xantha]RBP51633.1 single-stranded DNA-specific DHH superfamily exonuclease [Arenicella xantha]
MAYIDCFNGDADGICALTQLRLHQPVDSLLVTGVKRDIKLLERVSAEQADLVTVLDISLDKNRAELDRVLGQGAQVFYCDHHYAGDLPEHHNLTTLINTAPDVCTSLLINHRLKGRFLEWAVVGTFGDNLSRAASALAKPLSLSDKDLNLLQNLGIYLNYNGYGASLDDLYFDPAELFKRTSQYRSAFEFMRDDVDTYATLEQGYHSDMAKAAQLEPEHQTADAAVYVLPCEAWARRVSGVFSNDLANKHENRAHAVLTERSDGDFLVSVRAPMSKKRGADVVCRQFDTGGGRAAAAGINQLAAADVAKFTAVLGDFYRS